MAQEADKGPLHILLVPQPRLLWAERGTQLVGVRPHTPPRLLVSPTITSCSVQSAKHYLTPRQATWAASYHPPTPAPRALWTLSPQKPS